MQITNNFMSKILVKQTTERKKKRAINFLGKIQKFIYGTLDHDDELYYDEQLKNLRINQETLKINIEKQFTLVRSVYEVVNGTYVDVKNNLLILQEQLNNASIFINQNLNCRLWYGYLKKMLHTYNMTLKKIYSL
jgi:hypothetical protein